MCVFRACVCLHACVCMCVCVYSCVYARAQARDVNVCVCAVVCFLFASCDDELRSVSISFIKMSYELSILMFMVRLAYVRQLARNYI